MGKGRRKSELCAGLKHTTLPCPACTQQPCAPRQALCSSQGATGFSRTAHLAHRHVSESTNSKPNTCSPKGDQINQPLAPLSLPTLVTRRAPRLSQYPWQALLMGCWGAGVMPPQACPALSTPAWGTTEKKKAVNGTTTPDQTEGGAWRAHNAKCSRPGGTTAAVPGSTGWRCSLTHGPPQCGR